MRNKGMIRLKKDFVKREGRTGEGGAAAQSGDIGEGEGREGGWPDAHFKSFHPRSPSAFPSPSVVSPFIWAKRNLHNEHVKRVIRAKEAKAGGRIVALLMSLPDIRDDGAFQRKILRKTIASRNTFAMFQCRARSRSLAVGRSLSDGHCTRKVIGKRA